MWPKIQKWGVLKSSWTKDNLFLSFFFKSLFNFNYHIYLCMWATSNIFQHKHTCVSFCPSKNLSLWHSLYKGDWRQAYAFVCQSHFFNTYQCMDWALCLVLPKMGKIHNTWDKRVNDLTFHFVPQALPASKFLCPLLWNHLWYTKVPQISHLHMYTSIVKRLETMT